MGPFKGLELSYWGYRRTHEEIWGICRDTAGNVDGCEERQKALKGFSCSKLPQVDM